MQAASYNLQTCRSASCCLCVSISKWECFHALLKWQYAGSRYHWQQFDCFFKSKKNAFGSLSKLFTLCYAFCYMTNANFTSVYTINRIWTEFDNANSGEENQWTISMLPNSMLRRNVPAWRHCGLTPSDNCAPHSCSLAPPHPQWHGEENPQKPKRGFQTCGLK